MVSEKADKDKNYKKDSINDTKMDKEIIKRDAFKWVKRFNYVI